MARLKKIRAARELYEQKRKAEHDLLRRKQRQHEKRAIEDIKTSNYRNEVRKLSGCHANDDDDEQQVRESDLDKMRIAISKLKSNKAAGAAGDDLVSYTSSVGYS